MSPFFLFFFLFFFFFLISPAVSGFDVEQRLTLHQLDERSGLIETHLAECAAQHFAHNQELATLQRQQQSEYLALRNFVGTPAVMSKRQRSFSSSIRINERPTADHSLYGDADIASAEHPPLPTTSVIFEDILKLYCTDLPVLDLSDSPATPQVSPVSDSSLSPEGSVSTARTLSGSATAVAHPSADAHALDSLDYLMREFNIDHCDSTIAIVERSQAVERDAAEATQTHLGLMLMREHLKGL